MVIIIKAPNENMAEITEKDLPGLIERLKKYARTKPLREDEIDDFSQEAAFAIFRGRKASYGQLYVDFLRKTYGDTRSPGNVAKSRQTIFYSDFDENMFGRDPRDGLSDRTSTRSVTEVCQVLNFREYIAMHDDQESCAFSQSRRSQLVKSARTKIQEYLDLQHAYHLMETEDLWISYIEIS